MSEEELELVYRAILVRCLETSASVKHTEGYAKILNSELDKAMEIFK